MKNDMTYRRALLIVEQFDDLVCFRTGGGCGGRRLASSLQRHQVARKIRRRPDCVHTGVNRRASHAQQRRSRGAERIVGRSHTPQEQSSGRGVNPREPPPLFTPLT
jgi:hypothetical protein